MPKEDKSEIPTADAVARMPRQLLFDVAGLRAVVTGGGSGIGAMVAAALLRNGCNVAIVSRKDLTDTAAGLHGLASSAGARCLAVSGIDVSKTDDVGRMVAALRGGGFAEVDVLWNNSGTNYNSSIATTEMSMFAKVVGVNLNGVFAVTQALLPLLEAAALRRGAPSKIVNVASINGMDPPPLHTFAYSSSKAAVIMLSRHLAAQVPDCVTVNSLSPGAFPSRMTRGSFKALGDEISESIKLRRVGNAVDIAGVALFLSSGASDYVNGSNLVADGGKLITPSGKL